jgi:hypothetical protein
VVGEMNWEEDDAGFKVLEEAFDHFSEGVVKLSAKCTIYKEVTGFEETIRLDVLLAIASHLDDSADEVFVNLAANVQVKQVAIRIHALWG